MDLTEFTEEQIENEINGLSRYDMCWLVRFAPVGHKYFDMSKPYWKYFDKRFKELGGFSPEISKSIGW